MRAAPLAVSMVGPLVASSVVAKVAQTAGAKAACSAASRVDWKGGLWVGQMAAKTVALLAET